MRLSMLPPSTLLYILVATTPVRSAVDLDFSSYPSSTQACLGDAAGVSGCAGETVTEENSCLCGNVGNFVINTAICIGGKGNTVMQAVWELLDSSCTDTKTPLQISEEQFFHYEIKNTVTSTVTTTSAGVVTTYTTTSTNTNTAAETATATSTSTSSSSNDDVVASARIGAITASVAGTLAILCAVGIIVLLKKWKKDKALLREAQEAARGSGSGGYRPGQDKPLLHPGDVTPGFASPRYGEGMLGVSVVEPPTPSHPGPMSPHTWPPAPPMEMFDASSSGAQGQQRGVEPGSHVTHWPSPLTQNGGTMGSWCPSPLSAVPTSGGLPWPNVGTYHNHHGGLSTVVESPMVGSHLSRNITGTIRSDVSRPDLSRQMSGTSTARSSWAHIRQPQEELYELPGTEIRSPVEADSTPLPRRAPKRMSMAVGPAAPPEYVAGGWTDPVTDKPPENWI